MACVTTIKMVFALADKKQWPIFQMDVKSTFLNGVLKEEIYVEHLLGFHKP